MTSMRSRRSPGRTHPGRTSLCLLAAALLSAACGTRVPLADIIAAEGGGEIVFQEGTEPGDAAVAARLPDDVDEGPTDVTTTRPAADDGSQPPTGPAADGGGAQVEVDAGPAPVDEAEVATAEGCAEPGPPIRIGQVGSWSGLVGQSTAPGRPALQMWAQYVNSRGGVACHPVEVISVDDRSDPARSQSAVQDLIRNRGVVAIVGSIVPISIAGFEAGINSGGGVPAIGGDGATPNWNQNPLLYFVGSDINANLFIPMQAAVRAGNTRLGLLYCVEASACANVNASVSGPLKDEANAQLVYRATISLTQTDYTAQCQAAKDAGVEQFWLGMDGASIQRLARSCNGIGFRPQLVTLALAAGFDPTDPNVAQFDVSVGSPVFPFPMRSGTPGIDRWGEALQQFGRGLEPNGAAAQAWAAGEMFRRAIELLGPEARTQQITHEMVIEGLSRVRNETLDGLIQPMSYAPGQPGTEVVRCGYLLAYTGGRWTAPQGAEPVCRP